MDFSNKVDYPTRAGHKRIDIVYGLRGRRIEIVCEPPQRVVVDGEDGRL